MKELKAAILGYGGIARSHKSGYDILEKEGFPIRLVALCDIDPNQFSSEQKININSGESGKLTNLHFYTDVDDMLKNEDFDIVDICLPSYLHKEYAIRMMRAGKHVQSEKPMALSYADCLEMLAVAKECDKKITIGQCLHFEASYEFLKACIDDRRFGNLRTLTLERLGSLPGWGFEGWYRDVKRSGGTPFDLHIHDIDMVNYVLGMPVAVSSIAIGNEVPLQYVNTRLFYNDNLAVTATASWDESATAGFKMAYRARFDEASLLYDGASVKICPNDGSQPYEAESTKDGQRHDRMAEEIRTMALSVADHDFVNKVNTPEGAANSILITEKIVESANSGGKKVFLKEL